MGLSDCFPVVKWSAWQTNSGRDEKTKQGAKGRMTNPKEQVELRFDPESKYVDFYLEDCWIYDINLNDFRDPRLALDSIRQISQKTWATNQTISELCTLGMEALKDAQ
jgi:hypothetical protein